MFVLTVTLLSYCLTVLSDKQEVEESAPDGIDLEEFIDQFGPLLGPNLTDLEVGTFIINRSKTVFLSSKGVVVILYYILVFGEPRLVL